MGSFRTGRRAVVYAAAALGLSACAWRGEVPPSVLDKPANGGLHFRPQDKAQWEAVALPGKLRTAFKLEKRQHLQIADGQRAAHADLTAGVHAHEPTPDMRNCLWKLCRVDALLRHPPGHALDDLERFAQ